MGFKIILTIISILVLISLLFFYFLPFNTINFISNSGDSNFTLTSEEMQYYPEMRFPSNEITNQISNCDLQKQNEMQSAFSIMENLTSLKFNSVSSNEEISIKCEERNRYDNGMFIAGEGGPTNISVAGDFYIIYNGEILLIKNSDCSKPNIALHELFHVLGFKHSTNPNNIMYNITSCNQIISDDMIQLINKLYSVPSYPDLAFGNVSAVMNGRFLFLNVTVINKGLSKSGKSTIEVYANENLIKEISVDKLDAGNGEIINLGNIFVSQVNINELNLEIKTNFSEINKDNNKIKLK
jgi:hypothetical protein